MRAPTMRPDELDRLGDGGDEAPLDLVEAEDLLVESEAERDEADERGGQERQGVPDAPQAVDLPDHPPALGERRGVLLGGDDLVGRAHASPLLARRAPGSCRLQAEDHEDERGDGEDDERHPPAEVSGEQRRPSSGPTNGPDGVGGPVEGEHPGPGRGRVVVGEQRVVGGVDRWPCRCRSRPGRCRASSTGWPGR